MPGNIFISTGRRTNDGAFACFSVYQNQSSSIPKGTTFCHRVAFLSPPVTVQVLDDPGMHEVGVLRRRSAFLGAGSRRVDRLCSHECGPGTCIWSSEGPTGNAQALHGWPMRFMNNLTQKPCTYTSRFS